MDTNIFHTAVKNLTSGKGWRCLTIPESEEYFLSHFESVSIDENNEAQYSNDPSDFGFTWAELSNEVTRLQAEWDSQEYARNRQAEYPSLLELTVALYDTDDKLAVEAKRAAVKAKYPKP